MSETRSGPEPHLFFSYASADLESATAIVDKVIAAGYQIWFDRTGIPGGVSYGPEIVAAIKSCRALLLLCSGAAFASRNVRQEIHLAWKYARPIVPLRLESVRWPDDLAYWLEGCQRIDLFGRSADEWLGDVKRALSRIGDGSAVRATTAHDPRPAPPRVNLPAPLTAILGRERELADLCELLKTHRLVTLTGPGGVGKTRLAIKVAQEVIETFQDGVWLVDLTPIREPDLVLPAIAQALGVRESAGADLLSTLAGGLSRKRALLLLDNFEHVISAGEVIARLLSATSELSVLCTSRCALHVRGERVYQLGPLSVNEPAGADMKSAPAVALFVERAAAQNPNFAVTDSSLAAIEAICARLDGLPLAIELAAARTAMFTPAELFERLSRSLAVLGEGARDLPERQRTLSSTIAWSHELLTPEEQRMFRRIAVFHGGCSLDAVEAVSEASTFDQVTDLEGLVRQSLVLRADDGPRPRFRMLETIREFALSQLEASGERAVVQKRHSVWAIELLARLTVGDREGERDRRTRIVLTELANVRAALEYLETSGPPEMLSRMAVQLSPYLYFIGHVREARIWCERALARDKVSRWRLPLLTEIGQHAHDLGDDGAAAEALSSAIDLARQLRDRPQEANAQFTLAVIAEDAGDHSQAERILEDVLEIYASIEDKWNRAAADFHLGIQRFAQGDVESAIATWERVAAERQRENDQVIPTWCRTYQALAALDQADLDRAGCLLANLVSERRHAALRHNDSFLLALLAVLASLDSKEAWAARWLGAAYADQRHTGDRFGSPETRTIDRTIARLRESLGVSAYEKAFAAGSECAQDVAFQEAGTVFGALLALTQPAPLVGAGA